MSTNCKLKLENHQLKESNIFLQSRLKDAKEQNENLMCENAQLKKECELQKKNVDEMNMKVGIVMQTMKTVFNDRHM